MIGTSDISAFHAVHASDYSEPHSELEVSFLIEAFHETFVHSLTHTAAPREELVGVTMYKSRCEGSDVVTCPRFKKSRTGSCVINSSPVLFMLLTK